MRQSPKLSQKYAPCLKRRHEERQNNLHWKEDKTTKEAPFEICRGRIVFEHFNGVGDFALEKLRSEVASECNGCRDNHLYFYRAKFTNNHMKILEHDKLHLHAKDDDSSEEYHNLQ